VCGICKQPIHNKKNASIDHIIPLSKGGAHELHNVHIAHRTCNHSKGNRGGGEQLLLVG
jgi:5-methylcytosine-specific restriction endonuclease McrA